ncbi:conserved hypothetical protein [Tenacibaculum maritimum]|nr:conserved hypothetical protein [Tenacibaculum maritimum]CAA0171067.1 conserved hypothetical protein [Tenacibaculum maritimum]CAA0206536.1 conserved hypothetical protein [Tenacibaculum maritimum]
MRIYTINGLLLSMKNRCVRIKYPTRLFHLSRGLFSVENAKVDVITRLATLFFINKSYCKMNKTIYTITKSNVECYKIRSNSHSWADITIDAKDNTGRIQIVSDFGYWQFFWGACGKPFKKFLKGLEIDYVANKFNANRWFDLNETVKYLTNRIEEYEEDQTQKQALLNELYSIEYCSSEMEFRQEIQNCSLLMKMENQFPELQYGIDPGFKRFWSELWDIFLNELIIEEF